MFEARQDIHAPRPVMEESEPIPDQEIRGQRLWLWIGVVALIFVVVFLVYVASN